MRGATPLDVAAASVMDNNELALALTESNLQKVSARFDRLVNREGQRNGFDPSVYVLFSVQVIHYLASCGLKSCPMLVAKGYPDIGWNPVEGERYLDFLRFAVFCNGNLRALFKNSSVMTAW